MKHGIVIAVILMTGCAEKSDTSPPSTVEVLVPVAVKCAISQPVPPAFSVDSLAIGSSIDVQMRALRAERLQRQGYEVLLRAEIDKCKQ